MPHYYSTKPHDVWDFSTAPPPELIITSGWEYWELSFDRVTGHCRVIVSDNVSKIRSVVLSVCV